jgi:hypothetical protein
MNCKQIREAIDTASRHNPRGGDVASHLSNCPDCHRYSDETASLTRLLGAQPRVEAPPDFEFRLRARLLRTPARPEIYPQGVLWKILPGTFSWGQTVAAAAALTLVVTVSVFYVNRGNVASEPGSSATADRALDPQPNRGGSSQEIKSPAPESVAATPLRFTPRSVKSKPAPAPPNNVAGIDDSAPLYSHVTKRLLKDRGVFYGAETASISLAKPAGAALTF